MVNRRLLDGKGIEEARGFESNADYLMVSGLCGTGSKPRPAEPKAMTPGSSKASGNQETKSDQRPPATEGLFGEILDQMRPAMEEETKSVAESNSEDEASLIESRGYEVRDYHPASAEPTERLDRLVHLRSINPLFGVYLADQLAIADPLERLLPWRVS